MKAMSVKRIAVTIEHGHANHLADDWSATAYWYQVGEPRAVEIAPVEDRLPERSGFDAAPGPIAPPASLADEVNAARAQVTARQEEFQERYRSRIQTATDRAASQEAANRDHAVDLRSRFH